MKNINWIFSQVPFVVFMFILSLLLILPVSAAKTFDNRDLRGEFIFSLNEAEWEFYDGGRAIQYCESVGTAIADGEGNMQIESTVRCNINETQTFESNSEFITYQVQPNGEVLFVGSDPNDVTHGFLLQQGRLLLIDGTTHSDPSIIYQHGTAFKK